MAKTRLRISRTRIPKAIALSGSKMFFSNYRRIGLISRLGIIAGIFICIIIFSSLILYWLDIRTDSSFSYSQYLWTVVCTVFGVADFAEAHPVSLLGKIIIFFLSLVGIAIIGWIIAEFAGNFVLKKIKEVMGLSSCNFKGHYLLCGWNEGASNLIQELEAKGVPLVIISPKNPGIDYKGKYLYIAGDPANEEVLERANIKNAKVAIVLADRSSGKTADDIDAKTILTALAIESKNPAVYTIIEILDSKNIQHAKRAKVDDIIVSEKILFSVLACCAVNQGLSKFLQDLLSFSDEGAFFKIEEVPEEFRGKKFKEVLSFYRQKRELPIGLLIPPKDERDKNSLSNWDLKINPKDDELIPSYPLKVVVIASV